MATTWTYAGQNATLGGLTSPIPSSGSATSNLNDGSSSTKEESSSASLPDHRIIGFITWDEDIHLEAIAASVRCWHSSGGGSGTYRIDYATSSSGTTWTNLATGVLAIDSAANFAGAIAQGLSADGNGVLANRIRVVAEHVSATEGGVAISELTAYRAGASGCSAPATPTGLAWIGTCEGDQATVSWNASVGADGYVLKVDAGTEIDVGNVTSYALTSGITAGTDYDVQVAAYNDCGTSAYSSAVTASPCDEDCADPAGPWPTPSESPRVTAILSSADGARKTLPGRHVQKCSFSDERYGGWTKGEVTLTITEDELTAYGLTLSHGDRIEFWFDGIEGGAATRYYRGFVNSIRRVEGDPYTITLGAHGLSLRAGQCVVESAYLYPSAVDIARAFTQIANEVVVPILKPEFTTFLVTGEDCGATVQAVESTNKPFGEIVNDLVQNQGANLALWGYDVSSDGDDRLYISPFDTTLSYSIAVPGVNVTGAQTESSSADIVNDITLLAGNPRYPNPIYNSSFERPRFGGEGTGNQIPNGGFEATSDWSGTGSYKSNTSDTGEGSAFAGTRMYETDDTGEYVQQTINPPATAIVVGDDYVLSWRAKCEDESAAVTGLVTLTWLTSGGTTISTQTLTLSSPTSADDIKLSSSWQQFQIAGRAPATAAGIKVRAEVSADGGFEEGILWDEFEFYSTSVVYQDGWELAGDGTGTVNAVNWQFADAGGVADGNACVFVDISASDSDANEMRLQPSGQQKIAIDGGGAYTIAVSLRSPIGVTANGKMQLVVREFKSNGQEVGSPTRYNIAAGSGWTTWTRYSTTRTAAQTSTHFLVYLAFRGNSQVLVDAFSCRDSTAGATYIRDGSLTFRYDTDDAALTGLSSAAADSITTYGRRPGVERVDSITTAEDAEAFVTAFFNARAVAFPNPAIEVVNPPYQFRPGQLVKLTGADGVAMMGGETSLPIVRVNWSWDGLLKASLELKSEQPDQVALLLKKIKQGYSSARASSYSSSWVSGQAPQSTGAASEPGGSDTEVQFNDGGDFAGDPTFTFSVDEVTVPGLVVAQDIAFTGDVSPAQITTTQNDYNPTGWSSAAVLRLSNDDADTGLNGLAGGVDGRVALLINVGGYSFPLYHENTGSTAANRFSLGGSTLRIAPGAVLPIYWDDTIDRWRAASAGARALEVEYTSTTNNITIPTWATTLRYYLQGQGGGGGGGARNDTSGANCTGGGGGSPGGIAYGEFTVADLLALDDTIDVKMDAGGTGGAGATNGAGQAGSAGSTGGATYLQTSAGRLLAKVYGGNGGGGGQNGSTGGTGGTAIGAAQSFTQFSPNAGAAGGASDSVGSPGVNGGNTAAPGGGGGSLGASNAARAGGDGGQGGLVKGGEHEAAAAGGSGAGGAGTTPAYTLLPWMLGYGGGGGASNPSGAGGAGGAGQRGGGGGGGGAGRGGNGGAGGNGGGHYALLVWT